jgi:hypothetical protein
LCLSQRFFICCTIFCFTGCWMTKRN